MPASPKCPSCGSYNVALDQGTITCRRCGQGRAVQSTDASDIRPQRVSLFLGAMWTFATIVAYALSYFALLRMDRFFWDTLRGSPIFELTRWTAYGVIFGVMLGGQQWLILRSFGVSPLKWIGATIIGWILGFWTLTAVHYLQVAYQDAASPAITYSIVYTFEVVKWGLLGVPHSVTQWVILRSCSRRAILWPITLSLGWWLGLLLGYLRWASVDGYGISSWTPAFGGSLVVALVSGACLVWILRAPQST